MLSAQAEKLLKLLQDGLLPVLQNFDGILSFLGALPQARQSKALLNSSSVGVLSSSSMTGNPGMELTAASVTMFWVE